MAAGNAFLALAGPVGWAISSVALLTSGLLFWKSSSDKKQIDNIFTLISERDVKFYSLAIVELNERITRIVNESERLYEAVTNIVEFGVDYNAMTEKQQYELGAYVNLMSSSTQLLVNPIQGLQPKLSSDDFTEFILWNGRKMSIHLCREYRDLIISLSNLLYKIDLNDNERLLLYKTFSKNKKMLKSLNVKKKEFTFDIFTAVDEALCYSYAK